MNLFRIRKLALTLNTRLAQALVPVWPKMAISILKTNLRWCDWELGKLQKEITK